MLQLCSRATGHAIPWFWAAVDTVASLVLIPLPHDAEQADHGDHVYWQCTGHGAKLQLCSSDNIGHGKPPDGCDTTVRARD
jgi:hypothetical protein